MVENRINNTDPVVQVRLCVMVGNFHGACKKVRLAAGFVYPKLSIRLLLLASGGNMQNQRTHKRTNGWSAYKIVAVIGVILLIVAASYMAYDAIDTQARISSSY